jgi:xanthine/CO dehydrogenase XdhC/CoxF family maturation factor
VDLLLEPVETPECTALLSAIERALGGERSAVVTWFPGEGKPLRRVVMGSGGELVFASEGLGEKKLACAHGLRPGEEYEGRFVEEMRAPQRLFVLGAGDDARPLVAIALMMGWSVTVADGRAHLARTERFAAGTDCVVALDSSGVSKLGISGDDAVVVMTHSYEQDRELLTALFPIQPRYLGLLGARHRSSLLVSEAAAMAGLPVEECCERIWAPVGLDLGGDGPEAIALAVMAEAQGACTGKLATSRRLTAADVARHVREGGSSRYLQTQCAADAAR